MKRFYCAVFLLISTQGRGENTRGTKQTTTGFNQNNQLLTRAQEDKLPVPTRF